VNSLKAFELGRSTVGGRRTCTGRCLLERSTTAGSDLLKYFVWNCWDTCRSGSTTMNAFTHL